MPGKVFISCGQSNDNEKKVSKDISDWLTSCNYSPYVAIQTQSILDVNSGIINELKNSDFYLFINFRRERIINGIFKIFRKPIYRGSVFTNQELSIAYALDFDKMLFINQKGVKRDGLFNYLVSNTPEFSSYDEVLPIIKNAINVANWVPSYSRNLAYDNLSWSNPIQYNDHTGQRLIKALHIDIINHRPDIGAFNSVMKLKSILSNGILSPSPDSSHLKCDGAPGYSNIIWPNDHVAYDLLCIDLNNQSNIYLLSSLDVIPRRPIISSMGQYDLEYIVFAECFPPLTFKIQLDITGNTNTTIARII